MRRSITISLFVLLVGTVTPTVVSGHCNPGQECMPDPLNLHHGGLAKATPEVRDFVGVMENMNQATTQESLREIILVPKIRAPVDPQTELPRLPKLDLPPGGISAETNLSPGAGQPLPTRRVVRKPAGRPLTPAEFARQGLPIRSANDVDTVSRGVLDVSRALLNASAIERVAKEEAQVSSGRLTSVNLDITNEALKKLRAYDRIMQETRDRARMGDLNLSQEVLTDLERVYRATQSIIQLPE